jgi:integrase
MSAKITLYKPTWTDAEGAERESPHWHFVIHFAGRRYRGTTRQRKKTLAQAFAEAELRRIERSYAGLPAEDTPDQRIRTVAQALADYEKMYAADHRPRALRLVQDRARYLNAKLGSCLLAELTEAKIADYILRRKADGLGPRSINIEIGVLARALGNTRRALWPRLKPLREPKDVGRALTDEEVARVLAAAAENDSPYIHAALVLALMTGMRRGEIENLTWAQVDWARNTIKVGASKTEAGEGREIPMNADCRARLELHAAWFASRFGELRDSWFVFPKCRTKRPVDPAQPVTSLKTAWDSVRKAAGVEARFHDLRHTAASRMGRGGASRAAMMKVLGHASTALVDKYCHAERQDVEAAVRALELPKAERDCQSERQSRPNKGIVENRKSFVIN